VTMAQGQAADLKNTGARGMRPQGGERRSPLRR